MGLTVSASAAGHRPGTLTRERQHNSHHLCSRRLWRVRWNEGLGASLRQSKPFRNRNERRVRLSTAASPSTREILAHLSVDRRECVDDARVVLEAVGCFEVFIASGTPETTLQVDHQRVADTAAVDR